MLMRRRPLPRGLLRGRYWMSDGLIAETRRALLTFYEAGRGDGGHEGICFWAGLEGPDVTRLPETRPRRQRIGKSRVMTVRYVEHVRLIRGSGLQGPGSSRLCGSRRRSRSTECGRGRRGWAARTEGGGVAMRRVSRCGGRCRGSAAPGPQSPRHPSPRIDRSDPRLASGRCSSVSAGHRQPK